MRRLVVSLLPSVLVVVAALALGEVVLRCQYEKIERITGVVEWTPGQWGDLTYYWDLYHPRLGWTNQPGYRSDARVPFQVSINAQGLRGGRDYASRAPAGVRRIAVFGDSCAFGEEVDDHETVPIYLERQLEDVEVLNFGVRGYGLGQMAMRLEEEGFDFHPDHVVFLVVLPSDLMRDAVDHFSHPKPVFRMADSRLEVGNVPVPEASRQPWWLRHSFALAWLFGRPWLFGSPEEKASPHDLKLRLEVTAALLRRVQEQVDARRIRLTVVSIIVPAAAQRISRGRARVLNYMRTGLHSLDLDVLDQVDFLDDAFQREGRALVAPIAHWSRRGNCLIAREIARHLAVGNTAFSLALPSPACPGEVTRPEG